ALHRRPRAPGPRAARGDSHAPRAVPRADRRRPRGRPPGGAVASRPARLRPGARPQDAAERMSAVAEPGYPFRPEDRPIVAGGPFTPPHPPLRRLGYGLIGLLAGVAASFGNALVNVDVPYLAGSLGLYVAEASLLTAFYVAMNASTNLMLVKARVQFGIP